MAKAFLLMVIGLVIVFGVPVLVAVSFALMALMGSVGACGGDTRLVEVSPALSAAFQSKWDGFNNSLEAGQPASVSFNENEVTSRGIEFLKEKDAPISDLKVCLNEGEGEATGKVEVPIFGNVEVLVRGTMNLSGSTPEVVIKEIKVGAVPGFVADQIKGQIESLVDEQLDELEIKHRYDLKISPGVADLSGQP